MFPCSIIKNDYVPFQWVLIHDKVGTHGPPNMPFHDHPLTLTTQITSPQTPTLKFPSSTRPHHPRRVLVTIPQARQPSHIKFHLIDSRCATPRRPPPSWKSCVQFGNKMSRKKSMQCLLQFKCRAYLIGIKQDCVQATTECQTESPHISLLFKRGRNVVAKSQTLRVVALFLLQNQEVLDLNLGTDSAFQATKQNLHACLIYFCKLRNQTISVVQINLSAPQTPEIDLDPDSDHKLFGSHHEQRQTASTQNKISNCNDHDDK